MSQVQRIVLAEGADLEGFRRAVRASIAADVPPQNVVWTTAAAPTLFGTDPAADGAPVNLPKAVSEWIRLIVCHRDADRYALLYALVWRVLHGERAVLEVQSDPLVHRLSMMHKSVRRDLHKMHAFLRFRRVDGESVEHRFVAWFEPDHFILDATAAFFVERFQSLKWKIITPIGSLTWDGDRLSHGPAGQRSDAPADDAFEAGWLGYYESIFNPARVNPVVMQSEMPKKYWRNMPEARLIPGTHPHRARSRAGNGRA